MADSTSEQPQNSDEQPAKRRRGPGRPFPKGVSPNPAGRPRNEIPRLIRECTLDGQMLVDFWLKVLGGKKVDGLPNAPSVKDMIQVSEIMVDRGWGKATQPIEHSGEAGGPMVVEVVRYDGKDGA